MKIVVYNSNEELSASSADMIASVLESKPDALLCFPAGETSIGTFEQLIMMNKTGKISFSKCRIVGLDEWAGLGEMKSENCFSFLKKYLFDHIDYDPSRMCFFDGESDDLEGECRKTDDFLAEYGPVDMMLLGAGMNGHLGLNEPGTPFNLLSHIVNLDETTKKVGQKYFSGSVGLTRGISLGMRHILNSSMVILQLNGERKATVAKMISETEPSPEVPATALKLHNNSFMLLDKAAAALL